MSIQRLQDVVMLKLLALDRFTILLIVMVLLASFLPVSGVAATVFSVITSAAIAILFFYMGQNFPEKQWFKASRIGNFT